ncbi:MAG TPA: endonuclease/exonuclease/phosphatase family protein [Pyrinomonadaceae bacterium]|nr:endonuclease/exonuclease/phosphatase family protein [Pyrinomonadaceae bacterium]
MSQAVITRTGETDDDLRTPDAHVSLLAHGLAPHFPALARFDSTRELRASALYARLRPEIERVLNSVAAEDFAGDGARRAPAKSLPRAIRATAWNIERGKRLGGIVGALATHPDIGASDVLLLTELDYGMARTGNRFVARELAEALRLNYAFAPCYVALNKGSGFEARAEGENTLALHGNAVLSRWPLTNAHSLALPNGKDKMRGKEKRLGSQRAVVADVEHPLGAFRVVSVHLDAHSSQAHRRRQMAIVLEHLSRLRPALPSVVGGDWNTTTYNASRAAYSIAGFFRRVLMGVRRVMRDHYPYPERWFERGLFREIERRGFRWRELNAPGAGTLHYHTDDFAAHANLGEWVPQWCFWFINWALSRNEGRCSLKLDWFAGRNVAPAHDSPPRVVNGLRDDGGPLSDHDPIVLDFFLTKD